jgi:nucleoside-diphosphate-sugar epimerase
MIIRLPGVFGGSTKSHGMLDRFVRSLRVNQPIRIHNSEVLHVLRDWVYSDDVANFIAFSLNNFSHGIYNFATGKSIPIIQYIHMAELITKNEALILSEELKLPDGIYDLVFDTHKLSEYLIDFSFTNFSLYSFPK